MKNNDPDFSTLANNVYNAVIDAEGADPFGMTIVLKDACMMRDALPADHELRPQLTATMHDYALMLAHELNPEFNDTPFLKHPCPHDDIVSALEESGLLTNE